MPEIQERAANADDGGTRPSKGPKKPAFSDSTISERTGRVHPATDTKTNREETRQHVPAINFETKKKKNIGLTKTQQKGVKVSEQRKCRPKSKAIGLEKSKKLCLKFGGDDWLVTSNPYQLAPARKFIFFAWEWPGKNGERRRAAPDGRVDQQDLPAGFAEDRIASPEDKVLF